MPDGQHVVGVAEASLYPINLKRLESQVHLVIERILQAQQARVVGIQPIAHTLWEESSAVLDADATGLIVEALAVQL